MIKEKSSDLVKVDENNDEGDDEEEELTEREEDVIINEIYPNPVGLDTEGEFIEFITEALNLWIFVVGD